MTKQITIFSIEIEKFVASDRTNWLDNLLGNGGWDDIRKPREATKHTLRRAWNLDGEFLAVRREPTQHTCYLFGKDPTGSKALFN